MQRGSPSQKHRTLRQREVNAFKIIINEKTSRKDPFVKSMFKQYQMVISIIIIS